MDAIQKAARVEKQALAGEELALINRQALKELTEEEVFVFRVAACDNQVDREQERFTEAALDRLAELYVGKTVIMDHRWSANGQTARIYAGAVEESEGVRRLVLRAYMLRNDQTAPLIAAIEGGILREVSVGCQVAKAKLTERSPKDTGEYARGWRVRTATVNHEKVKIIYNALRPDLTFMLEYGTHNRDGSVRMEARQHIRTALNEEIDQIMDELLARL